MKITVQNRQTLRRLNAGKLAALALFFMEQARHRRPECARGGLTVVLTDDAGIEPVNRVFLNHAFATDVITFALPPIPGSTGPGAEIHINVERALAAGARRGGATAELALYLAHGCDHLAGANDRTLAERRRMRRRELTWLRRARRTGCLAGLWTA